MRLRMGKERLNLTHENTTIFTFLGQTALGDAMFNNQSANHAFIQTGTSEKDYPTGLYLFEQFSPVYAEIAKFAIEHSFPMVANQRHVAECDIRAYMVYADAEEANFHAVLEGIFPDDFS